MPPKRTTQRRRPATKRRSEKKTTSQGFLRLLLQVLVVLLLLAVIAFAASYVYLRKQNGDAAPKSIPSSKEQLMQTTSGENTKTESIASKAEKTILEGTWVSTDNGAMLTFSADQYTIDFPSVEAVQPMKGSFLVKETMLELLSSNDPKCISAIGRYSFTFKDGDLHLKLTDDSCLRRSNLLGAVWFKL